MPFLKGRFIIFKDGQNSQVPMRIVKEVLLAVNVPLVYTYILILSGSDGGTSTVPVVCNNVFI